MTPFSKLLGGLALLIASCGLRAELVIEITQGVDNPTTIAVVPLAW